MGHDDPQLLEALKDGLQGLNNLRIVPHNETHILRLKRHLRDKIAQMESEQDYERTAA